MKRWEPHATCCSLLLFTPVTVSKYFMFYCDHVCSKPSIAHWTNFGEDNKLNQRRCFLFLSVVFLSVFCADSLVLPPALKANSTSPVPNCHWYWNSLSITKKCFKAQCIFLNSLEINPTLTLAFNDAKCMLLVWDSLTLVQLQVIFFKLFNIYSMYRKPSEITNG